MDCARRRRTQPLKRRTREPFRSSPRKLGTPRRLIVGSSKLLGILYLRRFLFSNEWERAREFAKHSSISVLLWRRETKVQLVGKVAENSRFLCLSSESMRMLKKLMLANALKLRITQRAHAIEAIERQGMPRQQVLRENENQEETRRSWNTPRKT